MLRCVGGIKNCLHQKDTSGDFKATWYYLPEQALGSPDA